MILKEPLKRRDSLSSDHLSRLESARYCDSPAKTLGFRGSYYVLNHKPLRRSVSMQNAGKCHKSVTRKGELRGVRRVSFPGTVASASRTWDRMSTEIV
jgi:hypothetical protein